MFFDKFWTESLRVSDHHQAKPFPNVCLYAPAQTKNKK